MTSLVISVLSFPLILLYLAKLLIYEEKANGGVSIYWMWWF